MKTFLRYLRTGIFNTVLGFGVIFALRPALGEFVANAVAFLIVVPISFLSHRDWSFRDPNKTWAAFIRFLPVVTIGYLSNLVVLSVGLKIAHPAVVQVAAVGTHVVLTYLLFKNFVFLSKEQA